MNPQTAAWQEGQQAAEVFALSATVRAYSIVYFYQLRKHIRIKQTRLYIVEKLSAFCLRSIRTPAYDIAAAFGVGVTGFVFM